MRLFIAEKPNMGAEIAKNLPGPATRRDGFIETKGGVVTWLFGHIMRQAEPEEYDEAYKKWRMEDLPIIPSQWKLLVTDSCKKQFQVVRKLLADASEVIHAGDPDREGQLLVDEVLEYLKNKKPVKRLLLNALDEQTVKKALADLRDNKDFQTLKESGLARARADWLIGMNLSRAYTLAAQRAGHKTTFPIGRVKTPTLALVVLREREIAGFTPVVHFGICANFAHANGEFTARWKPKKEQLGLDREGRLIDESQAKLVQEKLLHVGSGTVETLDTAQKSEEAKLPFSLSALQITASRKFDLDPEATLELAQSLYDKKFTSYPRSDCDYLPQSQFGDAEAIIDNLRNIAHADLAGWAKNANPQLKNHCWNDKKITAHHAIIPTLKPCDFASLTPNERKIYLLIAQAFLAQFYPAYKYLSTKVSIVLAGESFEAKGQVVLEPGWKKVFGEEPVEDDGTSKDDAETGELPQMKIGDPVVCRSLDIAKSITKPPTRFTTGTLVQAMKEVHKYVKDQALKAQLKGVAGIGTEASRAPIIKELLAKAFLNKEKKYLLPTHAAEILIGALPDELVYPDTTAVWETKFDAMVKGKGNLEVFMQEQKQFVRDLCAKAAGLQIQKAQSQNQSQGPQAAKISSPMPKTVSPSAGCPACGTGFLRKKTGKNGEFWGCSNYPTCKTTFNDKNGKPALK